jgi:hypothetical protein
MFNESRGRKISDRRRGPSVCGPKPRKYDQTRPLLENMRGTNEPRNSCNVVPLRYVREELWVNAQECEQVRYYLARRARQVVEV